jgi:predicted transcriptional regulator
MPSATVQLQHDVKKRLDEMKLHPRESYSAVISRLIDASYDEEPLSEEEIHDIEISLGEIRKGELYSLEEVMEEMGKKAGKKGRTRGARLLPGKKPEQVSPRAG